MPDSKNPDEPFDDIIEMFRNIAENGGEPTRASAPVSAPVVRNDSAADASVLGEAASAQAASAPAPSVEAPVEAAPLEAAAAHAAAPTPVTPVAIPVEPAPARAATTTEGVVPISTIEKLLAPTPRSAPTPAPYVGLPKIDLSETHLQSEPEALAAVINGTAAPEPAVEAEPVEGDDVVLTALAGPGSVPPARPATGSGGDGRRRRGVVIVSGVAAAALLAVGGAYALDHHGPSKNVSDTSHDPTTTSTFGATPSLTPSLTPTPAPTPAPKHTRKAVVPPAVAVPSSVPTIAPSALAAAQAAQSAALASASASLSAAIVAKEQQLAKHYATVITNYNKKVAPIAEGFGGALSNAPTISPKDTPTAYAANAFYDAITKATHYYNELRAVKAPARLEPAQSRLLAAMASARNNLINGQNVALNAQNCSSDTCTYGDQRGWAAYTNTLPNTWSFPQAALAWQTAVAKLLAG